MDKPQKVVVIGGTGLIGSKTVSILRSLGHEAVAASPRTGVNTVTGDGLAAALTNADAVIDVSNAPSWDATEILEFFRTSSRNLALAEATAGVRHHVLLSIVGCDGMPGNDYFNGKVAQEAEVQKAGVPYTIVRSTQFFEFLGGIADMTTVDGAVKLSGGLFQPIAADDVAEILVQTALSAAGNKTVDIAGPERAPFNEFVARFLRETGDPRPVLRDDSVRYFGGDVEELSLVPHIAPHLGRSDLGHWLLQRKAVA